MFVVCPPKGQPIQVQLVDHPRDEGFKALILADGQYLCLTPTGDIERRTEARSWERFSPARNAAVLVAERDGQTFVWPFAQY